MNVVCHIQDEMHREYLNSKFAMENGAFSIFRDTELGRFICSMVRQADFPVEQKINPDRAVFFRLPRTSALPSLFTRFSFIHPDDQRKINDFLIATFNQDFIQYYFVGKNLGLKQKDVITNFILSRKLISRIGEIEQLKKRTYRAEEKQLQTMVNRLARRVQIQNNIISKTILEIQQYQ
ncbi:hypothetical protein [Sphingobacterium lactis]|uniref:Uncharacterized protein n=1 Tax=Sphingobacterium lactis TaxID=797291 RepID=A0A1H6BQI3_9SPHI|nr:hypothetical protein [Sphingobacterium lactis]SEG62677.1 hypothetical protein SAMN05421877_11146 [Sphingobacterium lactis]